MVRSDIGWDEWIESKLFDWDTELAKLSFVSLDHVRVSLSDLLELSLDLSNGFVLELLDLFQRAANHTQSLRVNTSRRKNLISLRVLGFKTLLDSLNLFLKDQVAQACLPMHIVDHVVELLEQLLLFLLDVLVLLQADLVLPFETLVLFLSFNNLLLLLGKLLSDFDVLGLQLCESGDLLLDVLHRLDDHVVVRMPDRLLTVRSGLSLLLRFEIRPESADHVHVQPRDVVVVQQDVLILLLVLFLELSNGFVFLGLDFHDLGLALGFHVLT